MTVQPPDDRKKSFLLLLLLALLGSAHAEPEVDRAELPRIPPTTPGEALGTFQTAPGYRLEQVAAEPLVADPIAMAFDGVHRLFVVEMRGYSERRDEKLGRIRLLIDDDRDGQFDRSTVYAEGLAWPTAVIAWKRGIFVAATPDIWFFEDGDGDGIAESSRRVFTGFGAGVDRLNVQALVNSFKWGPGGRIHGATAGNGGQVRRAAPGADAAIQLRGVDFS
ncbi:MAG: PVC-type heme-binding CxxCH protein, partial [Verrucomicrobiales bacterium]